MMDVRTFLDRFRPAGAPGAPTAAAVPSDRAARVADELAPVFEALAATMAECDEIRGTARSEATTRTQRAADEADALLDRARVDSQAERAESAARHRQEATAAADRLIAEAEQSARQLRSRAEARRPELAARIADRVQALIEATS
jgi:hypothetical protein